MAFDVGYLERGLQRRVLTAVKNVETSIEAMMAQHAAKGMLHSGATIKQFEKLAIAGFDAWFDDAATFVFTLTDAHSQAEATFLERAGESLRSLIGDYITKRGRNAGMNETEAQKRSDNITTLVQQRKAELLDDFINGMSGSAKMKKDPLVSVTATQQNSPGAVQQLGIGSNRQTATVENYRSIIDAVDSIINSGEYHALPDDKKLAFKDVADVLKDEASKSSPDTGKLKRWAAKLRDTAQDLGMKVATSALATLIASMFG